MSALLVAGNAGAPGGDVIDDCTHGTLTKRYSQRDYRQAHSQLPADVDEYGNCRDVIRNAQVAGASNRGGGGGGAGLAGFRAPSAPGVATASGAGGTGAGPIGGGKGTTPRRSTPPTPATTTRPAPTRTAP